MYHRHNASDVKRWNHLLFYLSQNVYSNYYLSLTVFYIYYGLSWTIRVVPYTEQMRLSYVLFDFDWQKIVMLILIIVALFISLIFITMSIFHR